MFDSIDYRNMVRGKDIHTGVWVSGVYFQMNMLDSVAHCIAKEPIKVSIYNVIDTKSYNEIDKKTLCKCTGYKDDTKWEELTDIEKEEFLKHKNAKKSRMNTEMDWKGIVIYERDIVKCRFNGDEFIYRVGWNSKRLCFEANNGSIGSRDTIRLEECEYVKVIGNCIDNPEMCDLIETTIVRRVGRKK